MACGVSLLGEPVGLAVLLRVSLWVSGPPLACGASGPQLACGPAVLLWVSLWASGPPLACGLAVLLSVPRGVLLAVELSLDEVVASVLQLRPAERTQETRGVAPFLSCVDHRAAAMDTRWMSE